jgi:hypothetical protein
LQSLPGVDYFTVGLPVVVGVVGEILGVVVLAVGVVVVPVVVLFRVPLMVVVPFSVGFTLLNGRVEAPLAGAVVLAAGALVLA